MKGFIRKIKRPLIEIIKAGGFFYLFHYIIGVEIFKILLKLNMQPFAAGALAAQTALVVYGLILFHFNKNEIKKIFKKKITKEVVWKGIKLTLLVFLANFLIASIIVRNSLSSDVTQAAVESKTLLGTFLIPIIVAPIIEEFVFRGALKHALVDRGRLKPFVYVILSSIIFAIPHWQPGPFGVFTVGITAIMGVIYSVAYIKTNNIYVPIVSHIVYNAYTIVVALTILPLVEHLI